MKYIVLILVMLVFPLLTTSSAENYSCRDSDGGLHVADNLMSLLEALPRARLTSTQREQIEAQLNRIQD